MTPHPPRAALQRQPPCRPHKPGPMRRGRRRFYDCQFDGHLWEPSGASWEQWERCQECGKGRSAS